jgi:hypothetical protein
MATGNLTGNNNQGNTTRIVGLLELLAKRHLKPTKDVMFHELPKASYLAPQIECWAHNEVEFRNIAKTGEVVNGPLANDQI